MSGLGTDLRLAFRRLAKSRGFSIAAVVTLGLGIGANVTIFNFVNTLLFRSLPVPNPDGLVTVHRARSGVLDPRSYTYPEYVFLRDHATSLSAVAAHYSTAPLQLVADGEGGEVLGGVVSASYFDLLGVRPLFGRFFLPEEDAVPDRNPVAVLGYGLWERRFGRDPAVLGKEVRINNAVFRIVGVAPPEFHGALPPFVNELWIPTMMARIGYRFCNTLEQASCRVLDITGRVAPGRTLAQAQSEMDTLAGHLTFDSRSGRVNQVRLVPAKGLPPLSQAQKTGQIRLLSAAAGLLLLIACGNVAGLLLARATGRRQEIAVRLALGASRGRLVRELLVEGLMLSVAGGAVGWIFSLWAKELMLSYYLMGTSTTTRFYALTATPLVLLYSIALTVASGMLAGLIPAFQSTRGDLVTAIKEDDRSGGAGRGRLRGVLVAAQVALSLVLLVAAGLLARSSATVRRGATFDVRRVAILRPRTELVGYDDAKARAFQREAVRRLEAVPGVESVTLTGFGLAWLGDNGNNRLVRRPDQSPEDLTAAGFNEAGPRYFETLRIPILEGRDFRASDREGAAPVAIVNATLSERLWPKAPAVGRTVIFAERPYQVIGVVKDAQFRNAGESPLPYIYTAYWQDPRQLTARACVRVAGDPAKMIPVLLRAIAEVDPVVPVTETMPLSRQVEGQYSEVLMASDLLAFAAGLAILLSAIGLYAALAYAVLRRRREIGVRVALGATSRQIVAMVLRQGLALSLAGVAAGLVLSLTVTRLLAAWLYGVNPRDGLTFAAGVSILLAVALAACYFPSRRASQVDPAKMLRQ